jgi:hypothetical protein
MEDGFPLFDHNNEADRQEQKLREYYESFSANARRRLLAKTIIRPTSVYDILYPQTRQALISKNVSFDNNLEESAKIIRDKLIAKIVTEETDLEKISEDFRKSLLARAKIQDDRNNLLRENASFRDNNISKNIAKESNLDEDSEFARTNNVSKNRVNPSFKRSLEDNRESYKISNTSKNTPKDQDLLRDSEEFRLGDIHKNPSKKSDIETNSENFRNSNLNKNSTKPKTLDETANSQRDSQISKNRKVVSNLEEDSALFRKEDLSKNSLKEQDLLRDSEDIRNRFRKNDLHKNASNKSDIENDSLEFRRKNKSKNTESLATNLEIDSSSIREDSISKNISKPSNLVEDSEVYRIEDLSKNRLKTSDLEVDSVPFRNDDISKNKSKISNLEKDSAPFRSDDLSKNKSNFSDLELDSLQFRNDDLSKNKSNESNIEADSILFREDDLSLNVSKSSDLEADSVPFRQDDLSNNKSKISNLEIDSVIFRQDDISLNIPNNSNLEIDSIPFRDEDISFNRPSVSDIESDSIVFREDDLSFNIPNNSNLEVDSIPFREDDVSFNVPNNSNLEIDSIPFREDDVSFNVPNFTNLIVDSTPFLYNNLSSNIPNSSDIETDSIPFRNDDLASNVPVFTDLLVDSIPFRNDDLTSNVSVSTDLLSDSAPFRNNSLSSNVTFSTDLLTDSIPFRSDDLSKNSSYNTNLLLDSEGYRKSAVSKNSTFGLLGVTVEGAGTSSFLGISRVFTQGVLARKLLLSKNKSKNRDLLEDSYSFREKILSKHVYVLSESGVGSSNEYGRSNTQFQLDAAMRESNGNLAYQAGLYGEVPPTKKSLLAQYDWTSRYHPELQSMYGNLDRTSSQLPIFTESVVGDKIYSIDTNNPRGGVFDSAVNNSSKFDVINEGFVTKNIRLYNLERNSYNLKNFQIGGLEGFGELQSFIGDVDFQELISSTIGSFKVRDSVSLQKGTNTTPLSVAEKNKGRYFPGDGDLLNPNSDAKIGSAESMMAKTVLGNPFEDEDFSSGKRGVRHIMNTIRSSNQKLAKNYDPQNSNSYVIGLKDGKERVSRQKYTIANPYAPGNAGKLLFSIKNYASGDQYFFPPYIQSIQNTENASWNSVNFLGRPEAVYTYNNSSRDASITFFVLTDYAERVDMGRKWESEGMEKITKTFNKHFTDSDKSQNDARKLREEALRKLKEEQEAEISNIEQRQAENSVQQETVRESESFVEAGSGRASFSGSLSSIKNKDKQQDRKEKYEKERNSDMNDALNNGKNRIQDELNKTSEAIGKALEDFNISTNYSESNRTSNNVYNVSKPEDTIARIDAMRAGLMFQPAFFSGDKVDFVRKAEFLSKLTRPSASPEQPDTGFSFTKPPVCHIRLGDWWDHDIIVNSVSFDYAEAPWTIDGGKVQPMWASVTINFNIIGPYGSNSGRPALSTDEGGMYSPIRS